MIKKIENFLDIANPDLPRKESYEEITAYLIKVNKVTIKYYRLVFLFGLIGFLLSMTLLLILALNNNGFETIFAVKEYYPAILFSIITMAFSVIEIELKKTRLYKQLQRIVSNNADYTDLISISDDYKSWVWSEYQERYKSQ